LEPPIEPHPNFYQQLINHEKRKDHTEEDVVNLQVRLAGFRGTEPDGDFGPDTEFQEVSFKNYDLIITS
jgi:hypothetical protein